MNKVKILERALTAAPYRSAMTPLQMGSVMVAKWEGLTEQPRRAESGIWVIGYGFRVVDGTRVNEGTLRMSQAEAQMRLAKVVERALKDVALVTQGALLGPHQKAALACFVCEQGEATFARSQIAKHIRAGSYRRAAENFLPWVLVRNAEGFHVRDERLVARRADEKRLFETDFVHRKEPCG